MSVPFKGERRRRAKIEIRHRGRVYLVAAEKGGVGKTVTAIALAESLLSREVKVQIIEADIANRDIQYYFGLQGACNLQKDGGYSDLLNVIGEADDEDNIVVSMPAGMMSGAIERGVSFFQGLSLIRSELEREMIVLWPIDDKLLSIQHLANFLHKMPDQRVDVVKNQFFFKNFAIYDESEERNLIQKIGREIVLPRLVPQVMKELIEQHKSVDRALAAMPFGNKVELQMWFKDIDSAFASAGYFEEIAS